MSARQIVLCLFFAVGLSVGQIIFKIAADDIRGRISFGWIWAAFSPWLLMAICLYAAITGLWIFILTQLPLSKAYPFTLLGSALVPASAVIILGETIGLRYSLGFCLMLVGLVVMFTGRP
jgi:drug/metabolite transporter (DMT)-like permease